MLGPYEVESLLGAGGMGEVYRARDTRLDRIVAIKVLLSGLTASSDLRARFEREARAISALSHPHICALYDVGRVGEADYLVMEYLEGETLADRIARGPLPLSQVLRYGAEIAAALHHAHRAGITHRDLKPGNVMITSSGVKLLDFGLAKLANQQRIFSDQSAPATVVHPITAEGAIVGTLTYMSPEQLEGRTVDHRTDIFSLGCIVYEMAAGQRPFGGSSQMSVIAAILSADPVPLRSLQPAAPPALERIILSALEKNPEERWQTAHDVARQLRWLTDSSTSVEGLRAAVPAPARRRWLIALPLAAALGGLLVWGGGRLFSDAAVKPAAGRFHLAPPDGLQFRSSQDTPDFAVSPDGRTLCFAAAPEGGARSLFLRRLDSFEVRKIEGSEDALSPFWSSDGEWIGFSARGKLWKTRVGSRSVPEPLCDVWASGAVASWQGRTILFVDRPGGRREILRISDQGGTPVKVTTLKPNEWRHAWPRLLSDGRHFLYQAAMINSFDRHLVLASLESPDASVLLRNVSQTMLVAEDQLVYVRDAKLLTQRFDVDRGIMLGEPSLVAENVAYFYPSARAAFAAANGVIVYRTDTGTSRLMIADRKGAIRVFDDRGAFADLGLSYSNDGSRAAVTVLDRATGLGNIWIYDVARAVRDRFTDEPGLAVTPVWSPDGRSIVYSAAGSGTLPHLVRRGLSAAASEPLRAVGSFQFAGSFSSDGASLFYATADARTGSNILRMDTRTGKSEPLLNSPSSETDPQASPDGRWLAFTSNATGESEVYLQSLTGHDIPRVRVSTNGGTQPRWRRDGQELFYVSADGAVMSVVPRVSGAWTETQATALFRTPPHTQRFAANPDGQSFLFIQGSPGASDAVLHVITGWQ
jgi:eukaryotic-like serine/threonine-protein kinase